eukprot:COSAG02_NODE_18281_length_948_cov_1.599529_1_plen_57_part_10
MPAVVAQKRESATASTQRVGQPKTAAAAADTKRVADLAAAEAALAVERRRAEAESAE